MLEVDYELLLKSDPTVKTKSAHRRPPRRGHVVDRRKYDEDVAEHVFGGIRATMRTRDRADDGSKNISVRKLKE